MSVTLAATVGGSMMLMTMGLKLNGVVPAPAGWVMTVGVSLVLGMRLGLVWAMTRRMLTLLATAGAMVMVTCLVRGGSAEFSSTRSRGMRGTATGVTLE